MSIKYKGLYSNNMYLTNTYVWAWLGIKFEKILIFTKNKQKNKTNQRDSLKEKLFIF